MDVISEIRSIVPNTQNTKNEYLKTISDRKIEVISEMI